MTIAKDTAIFKTNAEPVIQETPATKPLHEIYLWLQDQISQEPDHHMRMLMGNLSSFSMAAYLRRDFEKEIYLSVEAYNKGFKKYFLPAKDHLQDQYSFVELTIKEFENGDDDEFYGLEQYKDGDLVRSVVFRPILKKGQRI